MLKQKPSHYLLLFLSLFLYTAIAYTIPRHGTLPLFVCFYTLFLLYIFIVRRHPITEAGLKFWIVASLLFRAVLLFSVPALSDDFYRFIWDGRLLAAGYHPFAEVPSFYMTQGVDIAGLDTELYSRLNAKETFTIYPPLSQLIFWVSVTLSGGSIYGSMVVMKFIIYSFEVGTIWILVKVLRQFNQPAQRVLIYALNPLVILEFTGNLHFEGVMIFFLMLAILLLDRKKIFAASLPYALSVCTKLIPLLFLPLFVRHLGWKKAFKYWVATGVMTLVLFLPLLNVEIIQGFSTSLQYYFQRFEFNASIYYLVREAGYLIFGFNIIQVAGPVLGLVATLLIFNIAFRNLPGNTSDHFNVSLFKEMLWCLLVYFLFTTILHPWYIITLLAIGLLTPYRFPIVWTGLIFLTYAGYTESGFKENLFLVTVEYLIVIAYLLYETLWTRKRNRS